MPPSIIDNAYWLLGIIFSTGLSTFLGIWKSDTLLFFLAKWFPVANPENKRFCGIWKTFYVIEDYREGNSEIKVIHIHVRGIGKYLIGRSIDHKENYELKANIANNRFVSGTFIDRRAGSEDSREGAFQVLHLSETESNPNLENDPIEISVSGRWIGYSLTETNLIRRGAWHWHYIGK